MEHYWMGEVRGIDINKYFDDSQKRHEKNIEMALRSIEEKAKHTLDIIEDIRVSCASLAKIEELKAKLDA